MLENIRVVLFEPKYPENIGMAARACLNMGVRDLVVVNPPNFDLEKALPLATSHARDILLAARVVGTLAEALHGVTAAFGTTARTGGWRKGILSPTDCAEAVCDRLRQGGQAALVFGPEKTGLTNEETQVLTGLVTIPTSQEGTSLNLAQAVLILLYECFKHSLDQPFTPAGPPQERPATVAEQETLYASLRETLLAIDYLKKDNPDYWMLPLRRFLSRVSLRRNEFNLLMGIARQVHWVASRAGLVPRAVSPVDSDDITCE
ncbi:MAG: RNA methyltransferase [Proteobacteria bacterium]|nr:RNA methyltransferase [Pseudomonadota bacterium]MBU1612256.1 RNA methyltransferase [Pseudomonadota bacterium]